MATNPHGLATVEVNGRAFVAGLVWKPLQSGRKYMAEAKAYGRANKMEMVTIRKGRAGVLQAGYAPKGVARGSTLYSLAAALAGQLGDNWVGVFPIDRERDRYALVAVFKGSVIAGRGDTVGGFDEIQATLRETYSLLASDRDTDFERNGRVIAPEHFEFGADALELADVLKPKQLRNEYRLRPLTFGLTRRQIVSGGSVTVAVALSIAGYGWWSDTQQAEEIRRLALAELARQQIIAAQPPTIKLKPWESTPPAALMLQACGSHLDATPLALGGWLFVRAECRAGEAVTTYARNDAAPVSSFVAVASEFAGGSPGIHDTGSTGTITSRMNLAPGTNETLQPTADVLLSLTSRVQALGEGATFSLTEVTFKPDPENAKEVAPDWTTTSFVLQTQYPPQLVFADAELAGVRIFDLFTSLNPEHAELSWTITGEIYGR